MTDSWSSALTNSLERTGIVALVPSAVLALEAVVMPRLVARLLRKPPRNHSRVSSFAGEATRFELVMMAGALMRASSTAFSEAMRSSVSPISSRMASWRSSVADGYSFFSSATRARSSFRGMVESFRTAASVPL